MRRPAPVRFLGVSFAVVVVVAAAGLGGCATTEGATVSLPSAPPLSMPQVARSEGSPALTSLVEALYKPGPEAPVAVLAAQAEALAKQHPRAWEVHEVKGTLAALDGDVRGAWWHFLSAAADLRARDTALYLNDAMSSSRSRSETLVEIEVLTRLAAQHPHAATRDISRAYLIGDLRRLGRLDEADAVAAAIPHLSRWRLLGAFDNDQGKGFLTVYPPEEAVRLDDEVPGARVPIRWRPVPQMSPYAEVPLYDLVSPADWSVAYLVTWVSVPSATEAELRISTADPLRAWVGDRLVIDENKVSEYAPDNLTTTVRLDKGWNRILLKSAQETGGWSLRARITAPGGSPLAGLEVRDTPPTDDVTAAKTGTKPKGDDVLPPLAVFPYDPPPAEGPRRLHLTERYLSMNGRHRDGLDAAEAFAAAAPSSPLAAKRLVILLDANQEAGKAIDLLNRVVDDTNGELGWFLKRRASFFRHKNQLERAQDDLLRLLEAKPGLVRARMDLAEVFEKRGFTIDRCRTLEEVLTTYPDSAWVVREKASCLSSRGFEDESWKLTEVALALEPGDASTVSKLLDRAVTMNDLEKVAAYEKRLLALRTTSPGTRLHLARLARIRGDVARARQLANEAGAIDPDNAGVYHHLGDFAYEERDVDSALAYWEKALARNPDHNTLANLVDFVSSAGPGVLEELAPNEAAIAAAIAKGRATTMPAGTQLALLLDHEVTQIKNDGSARSLVTLVNMAVNKQGQDALIQARVPSARTKLMQAYSVTPAGERQEASSIRGGSIRFRNPEIGTVTVVQYLTHRPKGAFLPNHFVASWFFQGVHRYAQDATWVVVAPKERKLNVRVHGDVQEARKEREGFVVRTFSAKEVPPLIPESMMPPPADLLRRVDLSTVEDWDEYVRWERALLTNAFRSNAELEKLADELTAGLSSPRDKLDRLFHYVAQEIRYQQDYESTIAGVKPHACPVVLERGYGDCKDKAVLLILLAKRAGIDVDFAILRTTGAGQVEKAIPNQQFNHAIVYAPPQEGIETGIFMDPTTDGLDMGNLRHDDQGAISLVLDPDTGKWAFHDIPWQAPDVDHSRYAFDLELPKAGGAQTTLRAEMKGMIGSMARRALRDDESRKQLYQRMTSRFFAGGTAISGAPDGDAEDIYHPLRLTIDADTSRSVHEDPDGTRVDLPFLFPLSGAVQLQERKLPVRLGIAAQFDIDVRVELDGRKVVRAPQDYRVEHPCFVAERTTKTTKDEVVITNRYEQRCHEVAPADYGPFRDAAQKVIARGRDPLVLSRK